MSDLQGSPERSGSSGGSGGNVTVSATDQLSLLNKQIIAAFAVIIAIMISIITINDYKKILSVTDTTELGILRREVIRLPKTSITIILITSFFYMHNSINDYQKSPTEENARFFVANILAVISTMIRFWNIIPLKVEDEESIQP